MEAPTSAELQAGASAPTVRYLAHSADVPDDADVGSIVTVEGRRARVIAATLTTVVVVIEA